MIGRRLLRVRSDAHERKHDLPLVDDDPAPPAGIAATNRYV